MTFIPIKAFNALNDIYIFFIHFRFHKHECSLSLPCRTLQNSCLDNLWYENNGRVCIKIDTRKSHDIDILSSYFQELYMFMLL